MPAKKKVTYHSKLRGLPDKTRDALVTRILVGDVTKGEIARQYNTSPTSVGRMVKDYSEDQQQMLIAKWMQAKVEADAKAAEKGVAVFGEEVENDLRWVLAKLKAMIEELEDTDDTFALLATLKEARHALRAMAEIQGKLNKKIDVQIDIKNSPAFHEVKQNVLEVLENHPEAKADFLARMSTMKLVGSS